LRTWVETHGDLPQYVRHSWKTAQTILDQSKTKKLDDF
jgi:ribonuclease HII